MSAIVLAGGKSTRIGSPKADLLLGKYTLLQRVLYRLKDTFTECLVIAPLAPVSMPNWVKLVDDEEVGCGPLAGLYAGLTAAQDAHSFAVGCDMPFINPSLARGMFDMLEGFDAVIPRGTDGLHPLCGAYSTTCLSAIRNSLDTGERRLSAFLPHVSARLIDVEDLRVFDPELLSLFNINTPEDLARAQSLLEI